MDEQIVTKTTLRRRLAMATLMAVVVLLSACGRRNWSEATRESSGHAPDPGSHPEAVVLAYRAKVWGVRGLVADHTWVSTKRHDADHYLVYEVIGWRKRRNLPVVRIAKDVPDRHWFGSEPIPMVDIRGADAERLIDAIEEAVDSYPYPNEYKAFPGPNSNTFTAWISAQVPELGLKLPARAIGKNFL